jgi:hypothetical protein
MIGASQLAKMKPSEYLINSARDGLIDRMALANSPAEFVGGIFFLRSNVGQHSERRQRRTVGGFSLHPVSPAQPVRIL